MRYTAYLTSGATLKLELESAAHEINAEWIETADGTLVNVEHLAALVPSPVDELPQIIIDGDGDEWALIESGMYRSVPGGTYSRTLEEIERKWGIHERR